MNLNMQQFEDLKMLSINFKFNKETNHQIFESSNFQIKC